MLNLLLMLNCHMESTFLFSRKAAAVDAWLHDRIDCSQLVCWEFCPCFLPSCCGSSSGGKLDKAGSSAVLPEVVPKRPGG